MIQFRFRLFLICLIGSFTIPKPECCAQAPTPPISSVSQPKKVNETVFAEPMVARVELRLTIGEKEVDVIEMGDLLAALGNTTVLPSRLAPAAQVGPAS